MPFVKGDPNINRNGRPPDPDIERRRADINELRQALKDEGLRRGKDFWAHVAEKCYTSTTLLIAVIKKFIPDITVSEVTGEVSGDTKIIIVRPESKDNQQAGISIIRPIVQQAVSSDGS